MKTFENSQWLKMQSFLWEKKRKEIQKFSTSTESSGLILERGGGVMQ